MIRDRDMLRIMQEISENPVRGSGQSVNVAAGRDAGRGARTAVGSEVPVPADDGWSEEESRRVSDDVRDHARIPSSGEERDRHASQALENTGVLTDADLIGVREPPGLGQSSHVAPPEVGPVEQSLPDIQSLYDGLTS